MEEDRDSSYGLKNRDVQCSYIPKSNSDIHLKNSLQFGHTYNFWKTKRPKGSMKYQKWVPFYNPAKNDQIRIYIMRRIYRYIYYVQCSLTNHAELVLLKVILWWIRHVCTLYVSGPITRSLTSSGWFVKEHESATADIACHSWLKSGKKCNLGKPYGLP